MEVSRIKPRPEDVPVGFEFRGEATGQSSGGFGRGSNQRAVYYWSAREHSKPIAIYVSEEGDGQSLAGTEGMSGTVVPVTDSLSGEYHDGMWILGRGPHERAISGGGFVHWDAGLAHSITSRVDGAVLAVRAPIVVSVAEMSATLASMIQAAP